MPNPTDKSKRTRRLRGALAGSLIVSALAMFGPAASTLPQLPAALLAADAHAATYNVTACNDAPGSVNHSWAAYSDSPTATIAVGQGCPSAGYQPGDQNNTNHGLFSRYVANSLDPNNAFAGWAFDAPPGNNIASLTLSDWYTRANGGQYAVLLSEFGALEGCWENNTTLCGNVLGPHTLAVGGATHLATEVGCHNLSGCGDGGYGTSGLFTIYGATVTVNDLTTPSVSASGPFWTGAWQGGTHAVTISGSDGADGIQRNDLKIDGNDVIVGGQHSCDYTYAHPCANQTDTYNYDTHQLSDGMHAVQAVTWDAGWLPGVEDGTIYVDNHAPTRVSTPSVAGGETWRTSNSFGISWTNPSQGSGAPIAAAHYSLCLASTPTSCPVTDHRVAGSGINSLTGITVPARGDYLLRVWDEDAAGNVNASTASDPVHLMFDDQAPGAADPAHANGWINAQDAKSYPEAIDLTSFAKATIPVSGIKGYSVTLDGSKPDNTVDVLGQKVIYRFDQLPEGHNLLMARAVSNAGVPAADSDLGTAGLDVDKTPPIAADAGAPAPDQWQKQPVTVQLSGTDQPGLSGMGGADPAQPVTSGAYIAYHVDGGALEQVRGSQASVQVARDGKHTLAYQAYDLAGNPSAEKSLSFEIDRAPPELVAFAARDAQNPRALTVVASDRTSGVADGTIEIHKVGSSDWTLLPTAKQADGSFTTELDDAQLDRSAMYEARALVNDVAGNQAVGSAYMDGAPVVFSGGLREQTKVIAAFASSACKAKKKIIKHRTRRHAKRAAVVAKKVSHKKKAAAGCAKAKKPAKRHAKLHVKRAAVVAKKKVTHRKKAAPTRPARSATNRLVPFGKRARIEGALTTASGAPIANADLTVDATLSMAGATPRREAVVRTDSNGKFSYDAPAGASRTLAFHYDGSSVLLPGAGSVTVRVPASASFRSKPHVVRLHQGLTFSGKLRTMGAPLPKVGKLVYLQAFDRGKWRKFAVVRTRKGGSFSYRFRFEASGSRGMTYRIKAVVPREAGYAFDTGGSKQIQVSVRR